MACVKYPFHVRHDGRDYEPGEWIEVEDAAGHLLRGAIAVKDDEAPKKRKSVKKDG